MKLALVLTCLVFAMLTAPVSADDSDDTLRLLIAKSDVIVAGRIASKPIGIIREIGVIEYGVKFEITDSIRGPLVLGKEVAVNIVRFEKTNDEKPEYLEEGSEVLLFLRDIGEDNLPQWRTADLWFGVCPMNSLMVKSLKRLSPAIPSGAATQPANKG